MHNNIISQVKSFTTIYTDTNINVDEGNDIYSTKTLEQTKLEGEYKKFIIVIIKRYLFLKNLIYLIGITVEISLLMGLKNLYIL